MAQVVLGEKELTLDDTSKVTADEALDALDEAVILLVKRMPGFSTSGPALMAIKAAAELLHWMYKPVEHPKPAVILAGILDEVMAEYKFSTGSGKKPLVQ